MLLRKYRLGLPGVPLLTHIQYLSQVPPYVPGSGWQGTVLYGALKHPKEPVCKVSQSASGHHRVRCPIIPLLISGFFVDSVNLIAWETSALWSMPRMIQPPIFHWHGQYNDEQSMLTFQYSGSWLNSHPTKKIPTFSLPTHNSKNWIKCPTCIAYRRQLLIWKSKRSLISVRQLKNMALNIQY
jgi:hypothetical protein